MNLFYLSFYTLLIGCESSERIDSLEERIKDIEDDIRDLKKKDKGSSKSSSKSSSSLGAVFGGYKQLRAEVPMNLKGIKTAEIAYESNFDVFVSADPYPSPSSGKKTKQWRTASADGFTTMGWRPDGDVRGTYWVTTSNANFTVWGIIDVDGDGQFATYKATKSENPNAPITRSDIY